MLVSPPNLKSKIFHRSDDWFPRYGGLIFWKFRENNEGRPTSKYHIFWTSGPIWKGKVSLKWGKSQEIKSDLIFVIWLNFGVMTFDLYFALKIDPVDQIKNADDHRMSQPYLLPTIYQNIEYVKFFVFA